MVRVLHIISGDLWAGAEVMAYNLVRELLDYPELDVSVYLLNSGTLAVKLAELPVDLIVADESQSSISQLLFSIRKWIKVKQPHIIHSHRYKENILAYLASNFGSKAKLIATQHSLPEVEMTARFSAGRMLSVAHRTILARRFNKVVGVSTNIRNYLLSSCNIPAERLAVILNGINLPMQIIRQQSIQQLRVGSAGRLYSVKDYPLMIDVAKGVVQTEPTAIFLLAGEGPERSCLEDRIRGYTLEDSFSLLGHQEDVMAFYGGLDIYLNTSVHEGIPMSILEAMAHGLPVVAPNVGGIGEIIEDGVDGFLIDGRTPEDFAGPILALRDVALRLRIGTAARKKISRSFSAQNMSTQYFKLYRELTA